jgi:hypothetical protein
MKKDDLKNLEEVYQSISNKDKVLISEDANETFGAALIYAVVFGLPAVWEILKRMYPDLKNKYDQMRQGNPAEAEKIKAIVQKAKQEPIKDEVAPLLTGGVRKPQPSRI